MFLKLQVFKNATYGIFTKDFSGWKTIFMHIVGSVLNYSLSVVCLRRLSSACSEMNAYILLFPLLLGVVNCC